MKYVFKELHWLRIQSAAELQSLHTRLWWYTHKSHFSWWCISQHELLWQFIFLNLKLALSKHSTCNMSEWRGVFRCEVDSNEAVQNTEHRDWWTMRLGHWTENRYLRLTAAVDPLLGFDFTYTVKLKYLQPLCYYNGIIIQTWMKSPSHSIYSRLQLCTVWDSTPSLYPRPAATEWSSTEV